jgi:hypothetical protein
VLESRHLSLNGEGGFSTTNETRIKAQLDQVISEWETAKAKLSSALSTNPDTPIEADITTLQEAIERFSAFAIQNSVPRSIFGESAKIYADLRTQAQSINSKTTDIDKNLNSVSGSDLKAYLAKLAILFGEGFKILLPFIFDNQTNPGKELPFHSALQRRKTAGDASQDQIIPWLQTVARVREGARRLGDVLTYSEILGTGNQMILQAAQLPVDNEDAWNKPQGLAERIGATCITIYGPETPDMATLDSTTTIVGLVIDEWVEIIPNNKVQTSLAFHYDAPGATAPQAVLLAVSPNPNNKWDETILATILNETLDLAKLRTVDYDSLDQVGHLLPATLIANNIGGDHHGDTVSTQFAKG